MLFASAREASAESASLVLQTPGPLASGSIDSMVGPAEPCLFQLLPGLLLGRGVVRNISAFGHRFGGFKDTINYFLHVCGDTYFGHGRAVHPPHFHVLMWTEILSRVRSVARAIVPKQVTHTFIFFSH